MWSLAFCLMAASPSVRVVVEGQPRAIEIEAYVAGVLQAELGDAPFEAQRALAVVARTYALRAAERPRHDDGALCDRAHCQVWRPATAKEAIRAASSTRGRVLRGPNGERTIVFHHAACGGRTHAASEVWPKITAPWLVGVPDIDSSGVPWCRGEKRWRHEIDRRTLAKVLSAVAHRTLDPATLVFAADGDSFRVGDGRAIRRILVHDVHVVLARERGWTKVRSPRFTVRTRGASYTFEGNAFGHLVGLCQRGAVARAAAGQSFEAILAAYFPKLKLSVMPREP